MAEGRMANHSAPLVTATHALQLLTLFSDEHPELGVTEMSERLGHAKSIVSRIVSTYVSEGVLVRDESTRRYRLGPLLLELGLIAGELHPLRQAADAPLKVLRDETGQNTLLWLREDGDEALCLASHRGAKAVEPPIPAGTRIKLADTVVGQALVETERRAEGVPRDETSPRAGWWSGDEDWPGAGGVLIAPERAERAVYTAACPITDRSGYAVGAIALTAPAAWFRSQAPGVVDATIARVAREVSERLG